MWKSKPNFDGNGNRIHKEIIQILHNYTAWETLKDLDIVLTNYRTAAASVTYLTPSEFDIKDLQSELGRMTELYNDLQAYDRNVIDKSARSNHEAVENTVHQIADKFPGFQKTKAYNQLFTGPVKYYIGNILRGRSTANKHKSRPRRREIAAAEICLGIWLEKLMIDINKKVESSNLGSSMLNVRWRVEALIEVLEDAIKDVENRMRAEENRRKRDREIRERKEKKEEARRLIKENLQCLCNVMKEVLGDRVEDVVVSGCFEYSSPCFSSCLLKESGMGGKILEINPYDHVIKDLKKRSDGDKNDFDVRDATLLLFNYAELHYKTLPEQQRSNSMFFCEPSYFGVQLACNEI